MNLKIFNLYFKNSNIKKSEKYIIPIQCWKDISKAELPMLADNTWDNISIKNPFYSELTWMYWVWKNYDLSNITHIWFCHYRRKYNINFLEKIIKKNKSIDIIMPRKINLWPFSSIESHYNYMHIKEDFSIMKNYMKKNFPNFDLKILEKRNIPYINNNMYAFNMFIMKKELFSNYCEWLFKILFDLEKEIYPSHYSYQKRVYWYLAERLLNVFIYNQKKSWKKILECKLQIDI